MQHRSNSSDLPIVLLPGLNGNARVFRQQAAAFPTLTVARWIPPMEAETLADYGKRLAATIDPGRPCLVGGVSFGGMVALEVARHLKAKACVVIASSRDVRGLPAAVRMLRPIASVIPPAALSLGIRYGWASAAPIVPACGRQVARLPPDALAFRRWAVQALLTWQAPCSLVCPVLQIHGERDTTFSARRTKAALIVPGAGHMLTLTHPEQVNEFLRAVVRPCAA